MRVIGFNFYMLISVTRKNDAINNRCSNPMPLVGSPIKIPQQRHCFDIHTLRRRLIQSRFSSKAFARPPCEAIRATFRGLQTKMLEKNCITVNYVAVAVYTANGCWNTAILITSRVFHLNLIPSDNPSFRIPLFTTLAISALSYTKWPPISHSVLSILTMALPSPEQGHPP